MKTTKFGYQLIKSAEDVLGIGYRSFGKNYYGEKLESIVKEFDAHNNTKYWAGKGKAQPDYCAITQSVILDRAFKEFNGSKNLIRSVSANTLASLAKSSGAKVNKTPSIGSLFIYERNDKGQGHIGLVWKVKGNYIETIEGNTESSSSFIIKDGCATKLNPGEYGILTRQRRSPYKTSAGKEYSFVHIEELFGAEKSDFPDTENYLADGEGCELMPDETGMDFGGSDGDGDVPVEQSFISRNKDKIVIGGGVLGLILLGVYTKFSK